MNEEARSGLQDDLFTDEELEQVDMSMYSGMDTGADTSRRPLGGRAVDPQASLLYSNPPDHTMAWEESRIDDLDIVDAVAVESDDDDDDDDEDRSADGGHEYRRADSDLVAVLCTIAEPFVGAAVAKATPTLELAKLVSLKIAECLKAGKRPTQKTGGPQSAPQPAGGQTRHTAATGAAHSYAQAAKRAPARQPARQGQAAVAQSARQELDERRAAFAAITRPPRLPGRLPPLRAVYVAGLAWCRLGLIRASLDRAGLAVRRIANIGFVSRDVVEFLVDEAYADAFIDGLRGTKLQHLPDYDARRQRRPGPSAPDALAAATEALNRRAKGILARLPKGAHEAVLAAWGAESTTEGTLAFRQTTANQAGEAVKAGDAKAKRRRQRRKAKAPTADADATPHPADEEMETESAPAQEDGRAGETDTADATMAETGSDAEDAPPADAGPETAAQATEEPAEAKAAASADGDAAEEPAATPAAGEGGGDSPRPIARPKRVVRVPSVPEDMLRGADALRALGGRKERQPRPRRIPPGDEEDADTLLRVSRDRQRAPDTQKRTAPTPNASAIQEPRRTRRDTSTATATLDWADDSESEAGETTGIDHDILDAPHDDRQ